MAQDPAFLFYTGDFTTGTQFFSNEQIGIYLRILMAQHQHGHLTEKQILHISKSYDKLMETVTGTVTVTDTVNNNLKLETRNDTSVYSIADKMKMKPVQSQIDELDKL